MSKGRRDGESGRGDARDGKESPGSISTPGTRSGTSGAPSGLPPQSPGKQSSAQQFAPPPTPSSVKAPPRPFQLVETSTRAAEPAMFSEALPVQLGKRTYSISGRSRDRGAFLHVELLGTKEAFEVPLTGTIPA